MIAKYENQSLTYTFNSEDLVNYILGLIGNEDIGNPGEVRLLL